MKPNAMKILPVEKIREADSYTIENEPIASIDLMERAAYALYRYCLSNVESHFTVKIVCGPGNNGGDGLALARMLQKDTFNVEVLILAFADKYSEDFTINRDRLEENEYLTIIEVKDIAEFPELTRDEDIVFDAIFGSGLSKPPKGIVAEVIQKINESGVRVVAIDIPSGLFGDTSSLEHRDTIIQADLTLSFQFPKLAFMYPENAEFVGDWHALPIGLHEDYINRLEVKHHIISREDVKDILKGRTKFSHKGNYGHALLFAGAFGKMGASVLAAKACLRTGPGLVTVHIPTIGNQILQTAVPEAMLSLDRFENYISEVPDLGQYNAVGVGPGIGMQQQTQNSLKLIIQNTQLPMVLDADALNIVGENKTWLSFLPAGSILTPHPKEFERIAGKTSNDFERNQRQVELSGKHSIYIVLKGAHTSITTPNGNTFYNNTGNPGMATAGSGDVLTGIILGFLAQGYTPFESCVLGVYLHGKAGDMALEKESQESLIAGDIIQYMGSAFKSIKI